MCSFKLLQPIYRKFLVYRWVLANPYVKIQLGVVHLISTTPTIYAIWTSYPHLILVLSSWIGLERLICTHSARRVSIQKLHDIKHIFCWLKRIFLKDIFGLEQDETEWNRIFYLKPFLKQVILFIWQRGVRCIQCRNVQNRPPSKSKVGFNVFRTYIIELSHIVDNVKQCRIVQPYAKLYYGPQNYV